MLVLIAVLSKAFIKRQNPKFIFVVPLVCLIFLLAGFGSVTLYKQGTKPSKSEVSSKIVSSLNRYLPKREAGLMAGIMIGDTTNIPSGVKEDFKKTGLAHILAVSGMNVSMLASAVIFVAGLLPVGTLLRFVLTIVSLCAYMTITGPGPSILRAGIMFAAAMVASVLSRKADLLSVLSLAVLVTLVYDPGFLFNVGWQLSFSATLFIVLLSPPLKETFSAFPGKVREPLVVTIGAQIGVMPVMVCYFHQLSLITVIANLLVTGAIFPLMIIGVLMSVAGRTVPSAAHILSFFAHALLAFIIRTAATLADLPFASVYVGSPPALTVAFYYLSMIALCIYFKKKKKSISFVALALVGLLLLAAFMGCQAVRETPPAGLRIVFVDVGQGDAALIQTEDGGNVLIDGGPEPDSVTETLDRYGVKKLDLVIISHAHADHITGLKNVLESRQVDMVLDSGVPHTSRTYIDLLKAIENRHIKYELARTGTTIDVGRSLKIRILWPTDANYNEGEDLLNNKSVVARVSYEDMSILFAGDIQTDAQSSLLKTGANVSAQIYKFPHHGSRNAADIRFIEAVHPEVSIISVGADNKFGHPARSSINKLLSVGSKVYRTDENGSIIITSDGKKFEVKQ